MCIHYAFPNPNAIVSCAVHFVAQTCVLSVVVSPIQRSSAAVSAFKSFKAPDYALGFKWLLLLGTLQQEFPKTVPHACRWSFRAVGLA